MTDDVLASLREQIRPSPAPISGIVAGGTRLRRRRRATLVGAVVLVAAMVVAATSYRPAERAGEVVDVAVPELAIPWWSEGVLHLGAQSTEIEDVTHLVATSTGALVQTSDGMVHTVRDGLVTTVGVKQPLPSFVVDPARGWVAWTEPDHQIVVFDPATGTEVARRAAYNRGFDDAIDTLIVLDDGVLTYDNRHGNRIWDIDAGTQRLLGDGGSYLYAQRGALQLVSADGDTGELAVLRSGDELWRMTVTEPIVAWALSPDGRHLVGITAGEGSVFAWDADTGQPQATGRSDGTNVFSAAFLGTESVAYTVSGDGGLDLVLCDPPGASASCDTVVEDRSDLVLPDTFWINAPVVE